MSEHRDFPEAPQPGIAHAEPAIPTGGLTKGAVIGIVVGALVILAGAIVAVVIYNAGLPDRPGKGANRADAAEVVEDYLDALAEGDAATARSLVGGTGADPLLSQEALDRSIEVAPISDITVSDEDYFSPRGRSSVQASFMIGDYPVTRDFSLRQDASGWRIDDGLIDIDLYGFDGYGAEINGVALDSEITARAFPGGYELGFENENFEAPVDEVTVIAYPGDGGALSVGPPSLTDEAMEKYRALVKESLDECLAMTTIDTPCGMAVEAYSEGDAEKLDGKVKRSLTVSGRAALASITATPDPGIPAVVSTIESSIDTRVEIEGGTVDEKLMAASATPLGIAYVDFSGDEPTITWED